MRSITAVLAVLITALALAACGGDDEASTVTTTTETTQTTQTTEPPIPTTVRIVVADGVPSGGIVRESVSKGDEVVLVVTSDVADEAHVHGYDLSRDVAAGGTVRIPFEATIPGRFEVELEHAGVQIAELTVNP